MKSLKRFFSAVLIIILSPNISLAQKVMHIHYNDGTVVEIPVSELVKVTFSEPLLAPTDYGVLNDILTMDLFPNPASYYVNIDYSLHEQGEVVLEIFSSGGTLVKSLSRGYQPPGEYTFRWQISDLAQGTYICTVRLNNTLISRKVIVNRR